ncbi:MAG: transglutaminase family protein [Verrucomicrobia bacterium]|nr:transglutaminase family protein [Verrucomicrobiota bacterium]MBV9658614.1 transglutaminase family protein [Verrucomicrobiota bacterium]
MSVAPRQSRPTRLKKTKPPTNAPPPAAEPSTAASPLRVRIEHHTLYRYERTVGFAPHLVRLFPRSEPGRLLRRCELKTNAGGRVRHRRDLFDNSIARCNYPERGRDLRFDFLAELELEQRNPFDFLLENFAIHFPFAYEPAEARQLAPFLASPEHHESTRHETPLLPQLTFWQPPSLHPEPSAERPQTIAMLVDLTSAFRAHLRYERRDTGRARSPAETLAQGIGACRDYAVLLAAILRELGLAARLVSGYLCEFETPAAERKADAAMHAWTDVYLPGAGWVGLDPTNGVLCSHHHLPTAVGLTPADISPILGSYYSDATVASEMEAEIKVVAL